MIAHVEKRSDPQRHASWYYSHKTGVVYDMYYFQTSGFVFMLNGYVLEVVCRSILHVSFNQDVLSTITVTAAGTTGCGHYGIPSVTGRRQLLTLWWCRIPARAQFFSTVRTDWDTPSPIVIGLATSPSFIIRVVSIGFKLKWKAVINQFEKMRK